MWATIQDSLSWIDGNWVDILSLLIALIYAFSKARRDTIFSLSPPFGRPKKRLLLSRLISRETGLDIANGCSLFPLLILGGLTSLSSRVLTALMSANKLILSVAGFCALLALLEDDFK
jgi:hypothetical protein